MLTPKQKQILNYLEKFIERKGYSPSLEELGRHFDLVKSTIHQHIETLKEKGYLKKIENQPRSIELNHKKRISDLVSIPLLGTIAAGEPIEAINNPESLAISRNMLSKTGRHYALRVNGESMIDEGIFDGDIIIIREQPTVENGETAVAYIPEKNEATLKKIYKERGRIRLQPANKKIKPFYEKNVEIQGKVISVLRKMK